MNNDKLNSIFHNLSDNVQGQNGHWKFIINELIFICLTDQLHNRMRIISPVVKMDEVTDAQLLKSMEANFHSTLDVRYAVSDGVLWAAFIHPLGELTNEQVNSAVRQVYSSVRSFGTSYSSGTLSFRTRDERDAGRN